MPEQSIAFGPFQLSPDNGILLRDGKLVAVGQKGALLLGALLKSPGQVRTKAELMDAAWPGTAVEESNLSVQIASLRKLLGPAPGGGEWIATVPRVGYRLVAETDTAVAVKLDVARAETVIPSLAVLPFQNISADPEQEYFADGIVEDIITALSRFRSFAVVARNSSFVYKGRAVDVRQAAKELGVRYVLEGSVRRSGNRLRITAQLVEGATGAHLWARNFDGIIEDVFDVQDRITESVAVVIEPQIRQAEIDRSRRERPESLDAYDLYLRALPKIYTEIAEDNAEALSLLEQAIALAPGYAIAMATATWVLGHRRSMGWPPLSANDAQRCLDWAHRGLVNAREDATVLAHCGMALIVTSHDFERGMLIIKRAAETNPNNFTVLLVAGVGHLHCGGLDEALSFFHRALRLSPVDPGAYIVLSGIAHVLMCQGNYQEALSWAERSLAMNSDFNPSYWMLIAANAQLGRGDEARRWLATFQALIPDMTIARIRQGQPAKDPSRLAAILDGLRLAGLEES